MVWPVLREQNVRAGHNVVVYYPGEGGMFTIAAGVEALTDFEDRGEVRHVSTPPGETAATEHYGEYSAMAPAYEALERWCQDNRRRRSRSELGSVRRLGRRSPQAPDRHLLSARARWTLSRAHPKGQAWRSHVPPALS